MAKVEPKYVSEVLAATDAAFDALDVQARNLKGDQQQELKRLGFDLDRVAADLTKWQRQLRIAVDKLNTAA